ncbi:glycosyltransferase [Nitratireductor sp. XY-223]|uniref:glycosyltransferase family 2 protein n=1 Tax=Nitratireductor sp. XY-223 TaxID=2561926 RepID=UPI00145B562D|nr:glycosyltransferase [Nitratireductor sp. XY-223]
MVLPITVVAPTYNSMSMMQRHVSAMREWAPHVERVVVVDSHSEDGTWDYLKSNLAGDNIGFLQHPPGLYESWNFGVSQSRSPFTYFSTVGDTISLDGLTALYETAVSLDCDVVISPPRMKTDDGEPAEHSWPIHRIIDQYDIRTPLRLTTESATYFATRYLPSSILGSSASNLYRTDCLKEWPFPSEFGHIGDVAWGALYATHVSFGIYPETVAEFVHHKQTRQWDKQAYVRMCLELFELASDQIRALHQTGFTEARVTGGETESVSPLQEWIRVGNRRRELDRGLSELRGKRLHWILNPQAWRLRHKRNQALSAEEPLLRQLDNSVRRSIADASGRLAL